jgi:hypothetical protein
MRLALCAALLWMCCPAFAEITSIVTSPGGVAGNLQYYGAAGDFSGMTGSSVSGGTMTVAQVRATSAEFGATPSTFSATGALTVAADADVTVSGAGKFVGSGAGLTGVPAASIAAGALSAGVVVSISNLASTHSATNFDFMAGASTVAAASIDANGLLITVDQSKTQSGVSALTVAAQGIIVSTMGASGSFSRSDDPVGWTVSGVDGGGRVVFEDLGHTSIYAKNGSSITFTADGGPIVFALGGSGTVNLGTGSSGNIYCRRANGELGNLAAITVSCSAGACTSTCPACGGGCSCTTACNPPSCTASWSCP